MPKPENCHTIYMQFKLWKQARDYSDKSNISISRLITVALNQFLPKNPNEKG